MSETFYEKFEREYSRYINLTVGGVIEKILSDILRTDPKKEAFNCYGLMSENETYVNPHEHFHLLVAFLLDRKFGISAEDEVLVEALHFSFQDSGFHKRHPFSEENLIEVMQLEEKGIREDYNIEIQPLKSEEEFLADLLFLQKYALLVDFVIKNTNQSIVTREGISYTNIEGNRRYQLDLISPRNIEIRFNRLKNDNRRNLPITYFLLPFTRQEIEQLSLEQLETISKSIPCGIKAGFPKEILEKLNNHYKGGVFFNEELKNIKPNPRFISLVNTLENAVTVNLGKTISGILMFAFITFSIHYTISLNDNKSPSEEIRTPNIPAKSQGK
jgi:hypothetical protein